MDAPANDQAMADDLIDDFPHPGVPLGDSLPEGLLRACKI